MVTWGSPARRMRASSNARVARSASAPPRKAQRNRTLAALVGSRSLASSSNSSAACTTGHSDNGSPSDRFQGRAGARAGREGHRGDQDLVECAGDVSAAACQIGHDDTDRGVGLALQDRPCPMRGRADLLLCSGLHQQHGLALRAFRRLVFHPRAGCLQRLEQRNALRIGAVEAVHDQVPGRAKQSALQQEPQLVPQTRDIEDGLATAEVDEGLAPPSEGTPLLAHRVATQRLGQAVRADDAPGLACRLGQRLPVQQRAFVGGLGNHALPQGELLLRGQQQR